MDELSAKNNSLKDQTRIILQHENSVHHLRSENDTLKQSNATLIQQVIYSGDMKTFLVTKN